MATTKGGLYASIQPKKGRLYAVIQTKENGKAKSVWRALGLDEGSSPGKIKKAYREIVGAFEEQQNSKENQSSDSASSVPVFNYLNACLEKAKSDLQYNTYRGYYRVIHGKIKAYFDARAELTIDNITPKDFSDFYAFLMSSGSKPNTVLHYHMILHKAFKQAYKEGLIADNPLDKVDRPKRNKFQGDHYTEDELITLLELTKDDAIYPAIVLAGGMGLRRSEALGVRWSRINFDDHTVLLDTKIIEKSVNGETVTEPVDEMKNKTSRRTLYIPDPVFDMLIETREKQIINRKLFKTSYNRKYDDYVCTDALGNLIRPGYVTQHFADLLKKNGLRQIRFHDLRHTFASILINKEVPLINVSNFLGHSTINTTANIYAHLDKSNKQATANVISDIFRSAKAETAETI